MKFVKMFVKFPKGINYLKYKSNYALFRINIIILIGKGTGRESEKEIQPSFKTLRYCLGPFLLSSFQKTLDKNLLIPPPPENLNCGWLVWLIIEALVG